MLNIKDVYSHVTLLLFPHDLSLWKAVWRDILAITLLEPHEGGGATWKLGDPLLYSENHGYIRNPTFSLVFRTGWQNMYVRVCTKEVIPTTERENSSFKGEFHPGGILACVHHIWGICRKVRCDYPGGMQVKALSAEWHTIWQLPVYWWGGSCISQRFCVNRFWSHFLWV